MDTMTERRTLALATDTALAATHEERAAIERKIEFAVDGLHRAVRDEKQYRFSGSWKMPLADVLSFDTSGLASWDKREYDAERVKYDQAMNDLAENTAKIRDLDQVWLDSGKWHRYFLVNNNNGHVHRDMACSTCYPTTQYLWLVELADCDEQAMVASYGELACTVCFPDAPTLPGYGDGTSSIARLSQAERGSARA